jgi:CRISPR-associated protein Csm3
MLVLALNEFNNRRCYLGGGASRGYGFADVSGLHVTHKKIKDDEDFLFRIDEEKVDPYHFCDKARAYLKSINNKTEIESQDFDAYYKAYSESKMEGNVVVQYDVETITEFEMPGVDEPTVTNMGIPIIPGSTIKGFLRHKLIENGTSASVVDDIFGSTKGQNGHRSRLVISDAFPKNDFAGKDSIPEGTVLSMWIVFDNVTEEELSLINGLLQGRCRITGKRAAVVDKFGNASKNIVEFGAVSLKNFKANEFIAE